MSEFEPIETARKDGTRYLLYFQNAGNCCDMSGWIEGWWFDDQGRGDDCWETIFGSVGDPIFWMPLPEYPDADDHLLGE